MSEAATPLDVSIHDDGSIVPAANAMRFGELTPLTEAAKDWFAEHIPEEATYLGAGLAVERRYVESILDGLEGDGLHAA